MTETERPEKMTEQHQTTEYDIAIVGAGFAGMYMLYQARQLGMSAIVLEAGAGVGGTWYWNRYPGARCDIPSLNYSYSFSDELQQEWSWSELYAAQPEIERYANFVADKFDLKRSIQFNTKLARAEYDEHAAKWTLTTDGGEHIRARYCVMSTGAYSEPYRPDIPGIDDFAGEMLFTQQWPESGVDFAGKRVGVVGTGSSGMQVITAVADEPIEHLHVFQRTANFAVPVRNAPMDPEYEREYKARYHEYRQMARNSPAGSTYDGPFIKASELSDQEFEEYMDMAYAKGGGSVQGGITDLFADETVNARVADYLNRRIRERVKDPATAELLCASGHHVGSRRLLLEIGYFEKFNQENVSLVSVKDDPIAAITPTGLRTEAGREYELDLLIFATGFDSGTGAVQRIDIVGRDGQTLADRWSGGPSTYLGLMVNGFPNMFFLAGPGSPSIRSHVMVSIEQHVEWLGECFQQLKAEGSIEIEATAEAETSWTNHVNDLVHSTLLAKDDTQYWGSNVPGKPRVYVAYVGGSNQYRTICDNVAQAGYEGFIRRTDDGRRIVSSPSWSGHTDVLTTEGELQNSII